MNVTCETVCIVSFLLHIDIGIKTRDD